LEIGEAAAGHPFNQEPPSRPAAVFLRNDSMNLPACPSALSACRAIIAASRSIRCDVVFSDSDASQGAPDAVAEGER
jgi:hypothetical protein